jgi:diguanylate cyclase (GGDEF)-like protein
LAAPAFGKADQARVDAGASPRRLERPREDRIPRRGRRAFHPVVRSADIACRVGGDEFAVILPESDLSDAERLYRRVQFTVGARPIGASERLHLSAGIAQLRQDYDATSFFERADEALYQAKKAGKGQFMAAEVG